VVPRHTHILTLSDPSSLVTELPVSELLLAHLDLNDPAEVRIDALGNRRFQGRILRIHPDVDPATRMGLVEVVLDPVPAGARAGQFARVTLRSAEVARMLVPFAAVQRDRSEEFVYRFDPAQRQVERQAVRSGLRIADRVEILDGLEPGQWLVTKGFLGLQPGKPVNPVNLRAAPGDG
jgi:RND family efflux transporter MFP subunit